MPKTNTKPSPHSSADFLELAGVIFIAIDQHEKVTLINKKGCEVLGCRESEILGKNWFDTFIPDQERKGVRSAFKKLMRGEMEAVKYYENAVINRRGEERIIAWRNILLKDDAGKISGTLSSGEDITERKKAEQALRVSEERYRMLVETMNEGITWMDENFMLTYVNNKFCKILGYAANELIGKFAFNFLDDPNRKIITEQTKKRSRNDVEPYELIFIHKDGHTVITLVAPKPIYDQGGLFKGNFAVITDITARKRAEVELQKSENMFRTLLDSASEAIMLIDANGMIRLINAKARNLFGYTRENILNNTLDRFIPDLSRNMMFKNFDLFIRKIKNNDISSGIEAKARRSDGSEFMVEINMTYVDLAEGAYLLAFMTDITSRKRLEEQLRHSQKMEAVGQMAAGIAHQLNTPLSVIAARLQLLQEEFNEQETQKFSDEVSKMLQNTERMTNIIADLLSFSRDARTKNELINLNRIVDEILLLTNIRAKKASIQIEKKLSRNLPLMTADRSKLEQVFLNIAVNALDAMPQGGKFTISSGTTIKEGKTYVWFSFEDTGTGIPKNILSKIFDPFFTTKPVGKGTGLGLSICQDFVKEHNGIILITSQEGEGTAVRVEFPVG